MLTFMMVDYIKADSINHEVWLYELWSLHRGIIPTMKVDSIKEDLFVVKVDFLKGDSIYFEYWFYIVWKLIVYRYEGWFMMVDSIYCEGWFHLLLRFIP